jgi:DNA polymerase-3 subunit delta'
MNDPADAADRVEPPPPRETTLLYGHVEAEHALLSAYRSHRFPHAWLLGGPRGIGKATLAYRLARFILAHPDLDLPSVRTATSLWVAPEQSVARRVALQAHHDLLVLERTINEKTNKLYQDIQVDDVRRSVSFFGSTPAEGGWRVAIVDTVDELNPAGANALLKILEEPPQRAVLLLVSHSAGRVLPTMRSRCRVLGLRPLASGDVARAAAAATGRDPSDPEITAAAAVADGSVRRALELLDRNALELRNGVLTLLERLPTLDPRALHALGERIYGTDAAPLATFVETVNGWLAGRLNRGLQDPATLNRIATIWEMFNQTARDVETFNLERKPLVFNVFTWLAEASRG